MSESAYWERVKAEAARLNSDGCSGPTLPIYTDCCYEHDIIYRTGRDVFGRPVSRVEGDRRFRRCLQRRSRFGVFSPLAWWRWLGVRLFGRRAYKGDHAR